MESDVQCLRKIWVHKWHSPMKYIPQMVYTLHCAPVISVSTLQIRDQAGVLAKFSTGKGLALVLISAQTNMADRVVGLARSLNDNFSVLVM